MKKLLLAGLLIAAAFAADAGNYTCQIDHSALYATGRTRTDPVTGTLLWEYKCPMGHTYWLAPTSPNADSITAPSAKPAAPAQQPDYSYLHDAGRAGMIGAGQQLGAILGSAAQGKKLVSATLSISCERFTHIIKMYSDGSVESATIDLPVDRVQLAAVTATTHGALSTVEMGCSDSK
jgi:hypothetical protein